MKAVATEESLVRALRSAAHERKCHLRPYLKSAYNDLKEEKSSWINMSFCRALGCSKKELCNLLLLFYQAGS